MIFELIVVDTKEQAQNYSIKNGKDHVQQAVFVGQLLCGVRHKAIRPNKLTRLHRPLETDRERLWESECLIPAMDKKAVIVR